MSPAEQVIRESDSEQYERAARVRALRPLAYLALLVGLLVWWESWSGVEKGAGIAMALAAIVMFRGKTWTLQVMLACGRVYLLVFVPLLWWPWLELRIWHAPAPLLMSWVRFEVLSSILIAGVLVWAEVTRWAMQLPFRQTWTVGLLVVSAGFFVAERLPAYRARARIDPAAWEQARRLVEGFHSDPGFIFRSGWWDDAPWNSMWATPAWKRSVMRCESLSSEGISISMGDRGIGPWFRHPRSGQPKGIVDYHFRDGSRWRGVEVEEIITLPSGERVRLTSEMRISHSPPTGPADNRGLSMPALYPED